MEGGRGGREEGGRGGREPRLPASVRRLVDRARQAAAERDVDAIVAADLVVTVDAPETSGGEDGGTAGGLGSTTLSELAGHGKTTLAGRLAVATAQAAARAGAESPRLLSGPTSRPGSARVRPRSALERGAYARFEEMVLAECDTAMGAPRRGRDDRGPGASAAPPPPFEVETSFERSSYTMEQGERASHAHLGALPLIFMHYAKMCHAEELPVIQRGSGGLQLDDIASSNMSATLPQFSYFCRDFGLFPALCNKGEMKSAFREASHGGSVHPDGTPVRRSQASARSLAYNEFVECVGRLAVLVYGRPARASPELATAKQRVRALVDHLRLRDVPRVKKKLKVLGKLQSFRERQQFAAFSSNFERMGSKAAPVEDPLAAAASDGDGGSSGGGGGGAGTTALPPRSSAAGSQTRASMHSGDMVWLGDGSGWRPGDDRRKRRTAKKRREEARRRREAAAAATDQALGVVPDDEAAAEDAPAASKNLSRPVPATHITEHDLAPLRKCEKHAMPEEWVQYGGAFIDLGVVSAARAADHRFKVRVLNRSGRTADIDVTFAGLPFFRAEMGVRRVPPGLSRTVQVRADPPRGEHAAQLAGEHVGAALVRCVPSHGGAPVEVRVPVYAHVVDPGTEAGRRMLLERVAPLRVPERLGRLLSRVRAMGARAASIGADSGAFAASSSVSARAEPPRSRPSTASHRPGSPPPVSPPSSPTAASRSGGEPRRRPMNRCRSSPAVGASYTAHSSRPLYLRPQVVPKW